MIIEQSHIVVEKICGIRWIQDSKIDECRLRAERNLLGYATCSGADWDWINHKENGYLLRCPAPAFETVINLSGMV